MHTTIAAALVEDAEIQTRTTTLQEPEHGLTEAALAETDVLSSWGHAAHGMVADEVIDRVQKRVLEGMGLLVLHSGHYSKIFKRLLGTTCSLTCARRAKIGLLPKHSYGLTRAPTCQSSERWRSSPRGGTMHELGKPGLS